MLLQSLVILPAILLRKSYRSRPKACSMNILSRASPVTSTRLIFGIPVYDLSWQCALSMIGTFAALPIGQVQVSFLNANNANILHRDQKYRDILREHVVLPDGFGMDIASLALNGRAFTANLNGTDFVPALLTYLSKPMRIGLIGGRADVLDAATESFRRHAPWHEFIPVSDGYFEKTDQASTIDRLSDLKLDVLIVGMGTPLQENWIHANITAEHARLVLGVGALFDFVSGHVARAPLWVRRLRCEWAFRLVNEPARLWRRYIVGIPVFLWRVFRYRKQARSGQI